MSSSEDVLESSNEIGKTSVYHRQQSTNGKQSRMSKSYTSRIISARMDSKLFALYFLAKEYLLGKLQTPLAQQFHRRRGKTKWFQLNHHELPSEDTKKYGKAYPRGETWVFTTCLTYKHFNRSVF